MFTDIFIFFDKIEARFMSTGILSNSNMENMRYDWLYNGFDSPSLSVAFLSESSWDYFGTSGAH